MPFTGFDIGAILVQYVCLLFSLSFHEAAHAAMANRCGDPTGRLMGRMTLNPIAHIDPLGTVIMPLAMMMFRVPLLFGWAKPVPFNPRNLHNMRRDTALVGLAGPMSNLVLAITFAIVLRIIVVATRIAPGTTEHAELFFSIVLFMVQINLVLMLFNLIPVPPLDGHHLLYPFLPPNGQRFLEQIGPFGILIAIFLASKVLAGPLRLLEGLVLWFAFWGHP